MYPAEANIQCTPESAKEIIIEIESWRAWNSQQMWTVFCGRISNGDRACIKRMYEGECMRENV